jgi:hypothetical protein
VTSFAGATLGATLVLEKLPPNFEFVAGGEHANGANTWYYDQSFLVSQHIRVWWFKKEQQEAPIGSKDDL